jgi:hypothetical protein
VHVGFLAGSGSGRLKLPRAIEPQVWVAEREFCEQQALNIPRGNPCAPKRSASIHIASMPLFRSDRRSSPAVTEGFDTPDMVEAKTLINTLQA